MARRPFEKIKDIDESKSLLRIVRHGKSNRKHIEMVVCDQLGDQIQVTVPAELNDTFKTQLYLNLTCTFQNFDVEKNIVAPKATEHKFKLVFTGGTLIEDVNVHQIPKPGFKFRDFDDINNGKTPSDILIDVIGAFHELGYTQLVPGRRKLQVNFKIKDLTGNILKCTLWEDFATQFANYNKERTDWGPTIVLLHNGRIKEATEMYELGVSNAWNGTKLYINADLPEIVEFKKGLTAEECSGSQSQQLSSHSQMLTQTSSLTQYPSNRDSFLSNVTILPLTEILKQNEANTFVTVIKTVKIKPTRFGWYYKLCSHCKGSAKGDTLPLICEKRHETFAINLRYRLDVEVQYEGAKTTFVFWDRECNELIGKTAAELYRMMVEDGVTNPLEYLVQLDKLKGRTLACRAKFQQNWGNYGVQQVKGDDEIIKKIIEHFPKDEETSKLAITQSENTKEVIEDIVDEVIVSDHNIENEIPAENIAAESVIPTQDLSDSSEYDPDHVALTPAKRTATSQNEVKDVETPEGPVGCSSSKLTLKQLQKTIKREKND